MSVVPKVAPKTLKALIMRDSALAPPSPPKALKLHSSRAFTLAIILNIAHPAHNRLSIMAIDGKADKLLTSTSIPDFSNKNVLKTADRFILQTAGGGGRFRGDKKAAIRSFRMFFISPLRIFICSNCLCL